MVQARRRFLQTGGYAPFAEKLRQLVTDALRGKENPLLLDVGCGEGYYTGFLYDGLQKEEIPARVAGFDISKEAVRLAAGRYKGIAFAVASSFAIPVADGACDCVTEVFSPLVPEEFRRVIKPGGTLILVVPGHRHQEYVRQYGQCKSRPCWRIFFVQEPAQRCGVQIDSAGTKAPHGFFRGVDVAAVLLFGSNHRFQIQLPRRSRFDFCGQLRHRQAGKHRLHAVGDLPLNVGQLALLSCTIWCCAV